MGRGSMEDGSPDRMCAFAWLGTVQYRNAMQLQRALAGARASGGVSDVLILLEHPPTYTLGRRGREEHFLVSRETLEKEGIAVHRTDRGGDVTFHGPGQLVGYPVMSLAGRPGGPSRYLRDLEEVILRVLQTCGITGERCEGYTGVWTGSKKIAAMGVKIDVNRVTQHGFALNVTTDLDCFKRIIPCGIRDRGVTTLARILGEPPPIDAMASRVASAFSEVFACTMVRTEGQELWRFMPR